MTDAARLIKDVRTLGATIKVDGHALRLSAPRPLPSVFVQRLKAMKADVLAVLAFEATAAAVPSRLDHADEDERAALVEQDGGIPRLFAEAFARLQQSCPAGVPEARWRQFIDDGGLFLDRWGAEALEFGWTVRDVFGLDHGKPLARLDRMGLVWLLKGRQVVALTDRAARLSDDLTAYRAGPEKTGE